MDKEKCNGCPELYGWNGKPECAVYDMPIEEIETCTIWEKEVKDET